LGSDEAHDVAAAAIRADGKPAADNLADGGEIRTDGVAPLRAAEGYAEAGHYFVEDEQRAMARADGAQGLQVSGQGRDAAHVARHGFHDDGRDMIAVRAESLFDGIGGIIRQGDGGIGESLGHAARIGDAERGDAGAGLDKQRIHVTVIAAFELNDEVPAGEAARQTNGGHGGLRAGVDQAHHFHGGHSVADGFGELDLGLGGSAEAGSDAERALQGREDFGMAVAQEQGAPGADVIDILVAIHVEDAGAFAAGDKGRIAAHGPEGAHRRIDAAGDELLGLAEEFFGSGVIHDGCVSRPGAAPGG